MKQSFTIIAFNFNTVTISSMPVKEESWLNRVIHNVLEFEIEPQVFCERMSFHVRSIDLLTQLKREVV